MFVPRSPIITAAVNIDGTITVKWGDTIGAVTHTVSISPGSFASQTVTGKTAVFTGATVQTEYTVSIYATNETGNSTTVSKTVDDFKRGLIWWIDVGDTSTLTFGPNRTVGGYSFPTVTKIADKSGTGTNGNKDAVVSSTYRPQNIITGENQTLQTTTSPPVYISSLSTDIVTNSDLLSYSGYMDGTQPSSGINRPGLLFRGQSGTPGSTGWDSLQGYCGGTATSRVPLTFFAVCKDLGNASFFGSPDDGNSYVGYDNSYGTFGYTGADSLMGPNSSLARKANTNFVISGLYEQGGTSALNININGTIVTSSTNPTHVDGIRNFNAMRICGRSGYTPSGYFCELMLHQRVLTRNEIKFMEGYMASRWNLRSSLPSTHPYYSNDYPYIFESAAPILYNSPNVTIKKIKNDNNTNGITIDELITLLGTNYGAVYNTDVKGIAVYDKGDITGVGVWQYSLDNGTIWQDFDYSIRSLGSFHLLSGTQRIRYYSWYNYTGNGSQLVFSPWNGTGATSGNKVDANTTPTMTNLVLDNVIGTTVGYVTPIIEELAPSITNSTTIVLQSNVQDVPQSAIVVIGINNIFVSLSTNYIMGTYESKGIAIYDAPTTNGIWQYKTNSSSTTWENFPIVDATNHFLLPHGNAPIRFIPNAGFFGTVELKFRAWDQRQGTAFSLYAVTDTGGNSAFSTGTATGQWIINTYTPTVANGLTQQFSVSEDFGGFDGRVSVRDDFILALGSNYTFKYLGTDKYGVFIYNLDTVNIDWTIGVLTPAQIHAAITTSNGIWLNHDDTFFYRSKKDYNGTSTFQYRLVASPTPPTNRVIPIPTVVGEGTQFSEGVVNVTIYVAPVNDAPVLSPASYGSFKPYTITDFYADEGEKIYAITDILNNYTITDVDTTTIGCAIYQSATNSIGTFYYSVDNKQTWTPFPTVSLTSALHLQDNANTYIKFVPTNNKVFTTTTNNGNYTSTNVYFNFYAWDSTNIGSIDSITLLGNATNRGGVNPYSSNPGYLYFSIKSGPPIISNGFALPNPYITIDEDKAEFTIIKIGDLLAEIGSNYIKYRNTDQKGLILTSAIVGTEYTIDNGITWNTITSSVFIVFNESNNNQIRYKPPANYNGMVTMFFNACDMINHTNGQTVTHSDYSIRLYTSSTYISSSYSATQFSLRIKVNAINDPPTLAGSYTMPDVTWYPGLATTYRVVTLSTIMGSLTFTDVDSVTPGIVIIGADTTYGGWDYTLDNTVGSPVWLSMLNISDTNALHLTNETKTSIRFKGASLAGLSQFTLRAWDRTNTPPVSNGARADASVYGGSSPYSTATATVSRQVNPTRPDAPYGLTGTSVENTGISLAWTEPFVKGGTPITGYAIYVAPAGQSLSLNTTVTTTSTTLTTLTPGIQYTIQVKAVNSVGESDPTSNLLITYLAKPQLLNTPSINLLSIPMNSVADPSNPGTTVEYILTSIGANYIPVLSNDTKGIAITSLDTTNGYWQYRTDYSDGWQTITATLSSSAPILLYNSPNNAIRFVPNQNFVGSLTGMTFMAWDAKTGTVGTIYTIPEGSMNFSTGTGTLSLSVIGFNTPPTLSGDMNAIDWLPTTQPISVNTILSNFTLSDNEQTDPATLGMTIYAINSTIGTWEYTVDNGVSWNAIADVSTTNAYHLTRNENTKIRFIKSADYGTGQVSLSFYSWDQTNISSLNGVIGDTTQNVSSYSVNSKSISLNVYSYPSAPRNIVATPMVNNGYINLTWDPSEYEGGTTIYKYNIYVLQNGSFVRIIRDDTTTPAFNYSSSIQWGQTYTFRIRAENYVGESSNTDTISVQFGGPPQLLNSPTVTLTGIERNVTNYAGYSVDSIIQQLGANYDDSTGSEKAIAITSFSNTNGTWQYWRDGINWTNIPTLLTNKIFLLSTWSGGSIRFIPKANYQGTVTISFRAWNVRWYGFAETQTYTEPSVYFSSGTATASLTIEGGVFINTAAPVVDAGTTIPAISAVSKLNLQPVQSIIIPVKSLLTSLTITDEDDTSIKQNAGIAITTVANTALGIWYSSFDNQTTWANISGINTSSTVHLYPRDTEYIRFTPASGSSTGQVTLKLRIWDTSNSAIIDATTNRRYTVGINGGNSAYSSRELTLTINIQGGPASPPSIAVSAQTSTSITFGWGTYTTANLNGGTLVGYNVYSVVSSVYTLLGSTDASTRTFTVTSSNFTNKTDYTYAITGITNHGEGSYGSLTTHFIGVLPEANQVQLLNSPTILFPSIPINISNPDGISIAEVISLLGSNYVKGSPSDETGISIYTRGVNGAWQYSLTNGTSWLSMPGLAVSQQLLLSATPTGALTNKIRFIPNGGWSGVSYILLRAWNPVAGATDIPGKTNFSRTTYFGYSTFFSSGTATAYFPIVTAPPANQVSLNNTPTVALPSIPEDTTSPTGTSIASLITLLGSNYVKGSVSDETGIAINSAQTANGSWQYSTNNGSTWASISSVNSTTHFLLSATPSGASTQMIRFVPAANYNGSATISFRAWNPVSGGAGTAGQTFTYVPSVYFSVGTASTTITITGVNDAPIISGTYTFSELITPATHIPVALNDILSSFTISDADDPSAQTTLGCAIIDADTSIGTWLYSIDNKSSWNMLLSVSASSAVHLTRSPSTYLKFVPSNSTSVGTTSIQIRAWDGTNGIANGSTGNASSGGTTTAYSINTPTLELSVSTMPSVIQNTSVLTNSETREATITWDRPNYTGGKPITAYRVYRIVNNTPSIESEISSVDPNTSTINITLTSGFIPGNSYRFQIKAINANGEGNTAEITAEFESLIVPDPPTQGIPISRQQSIHLSWLPPANSNILPITSYKIYDAITNTLVGESPTAMITIQSATNFRVYKLYIDAIASATKKTSSQGHVYAYPYTIAANTETEIQSMITQYSTQPQVILEILESIARGFTDTSYKMLKCVLNMYLQLKGPNGSTKENSDFLFAFVKLCYDGESGDDEVCRELFKAATEVLQTMAMATTTATKTIKEELILDVRNNTKQILDSAKELSVNSSLKSLVKIATLELTIKTTEIEKTEVVTSILGVTYADNNTKKDIIPILQSTMPNASIQLSTQETTTFKSMIPMENTTPEFQEASDMSIKIPPPSKIINLSTETSGKPVFITLEPDVNYKAIFLSANKPLVYSGNSISVSGQAVGLGSILTIGSGRFKVIQMGSLTLQYMPEETNTNVVYPPHKAYDASDVTTYRRDCTQYTFVKEIEDANPGYKYQYKSHTERLQALTGKITTPQAIAFRRNGGPPCS